MSRTLWGLGPLSNILRFYMRCMPQLIILSVDDMAIRQLSTWGGHSVEPVQRLLSGLSIQAAKFMKSNDDLQPRSEAFSLRLLLPKFSQLSSCHTGHNSPPSLCRPPLSFIIPDSSVSGLKACFIHFSGPSLNLWKNRETASKGIQHRSRSHG